MGVQSYRDLVAWQKGMDMVEAVYRVTQTWPHDEVYGLTNQARRAAVAVPANLAEGLRTTRRGGDGASPVDGWRLAARAGNTPAHCAAPGLPQPGALAPLLAQTDEVGRLLSGLIRSMR